MFHLSQGHLNLLQTCPRKFQHVYLEQLSVPTSFEQQARLNWGDRFHRLMQQRELGLPIHELSGIEPPLSRSMSALFQAAPELFEPNEAQVRQSEHRRTLPLQNYLLTVIYDLLILQPQQAQILDWKTYARPPHSRWLAQHWQTRLYLFVLAETSDYTPEQLSMIYWFVEADPNRTNQPTSLTFTYSSILHQQTKQDLMRLLQQLTAWKQQYPEQDFPQIPASNHLCETCNFAVRCQRENSDRPTFARLDVDTIEEIAL
ncbi:PD-(D/E)XK nuclease family protein [Thermocoleostomius sinensis]|uniref:PD-(D/E)XK nuclease family protein n=1 Tax=Thermocoleostomius sinensis A174 TaxID=2016057 RepID=A0A9E8ZE61_9CYAN|nr:PD-(D/E)XK nuclease family protein [Thermocoleostomius sinensis]WAL61161.1 PD-(D/E)XK nuclease family protein [Thermocoleostomius sinensis A174]